jgi:bifunctional non-homologous end joining protein LigD
MRPADQCARRFHPSVPANRRQAAPNGTGLDARAEARRLPTTDPCPRWSGAPLHHERGRLVETLSPFVEAAARIKVTAVMDAEVVCVDEKGVPNFDTLHSRTADHLAIACVFDLLIVNGDDLRRQPLRERKLALGKLLLRSLGGIQYVEHAEGHGARMFEAVCKLGLEGIVSKKLDARYKSGPSKAWLKIKNSEAPAATRVIEGTF